MKPLSVEIIAYAPTEFFHCLHCEVAMQVAGVGGGVRREQRAAAFPPELMAEYTALSDWVQALVTRHGGRVQVRIVDAASLEGVFKSLRYRTRKFPAVIVGGVVCQGITDYAALDRLVDARLPEAAREA